jgi:glycine/D-amino acid oxidase-like deaminating enzyme
LAGGGDEKFKNALRRDLLIEKKEFYLAKQLTSLFPSINPIPDFSWAGTFGVTKDALPYIGADPKNPNTYFVLGYGGNGITFSIMGMEIISDLIAGNFNPLIEYFKFDR